MYRDIDAAELAGRLGTDRRAARARRPRARRGRGVGDPRLDQHPGARAGRPDRRDSRATARSSSCARRAAARPSRPTCSPTPACRSRTCAAAWRRGVRCTTGSSSKSTTCASCRCAGAGRAACRTSSARGDEAFVIDPSIDVDVYLEIAAEHGWRIAHVFDTHLHADHLSGARALADAGRRDAAPQSRPTPSTSRSTPLHDGDRFPLGARRRRCRSRRCARRVTREGSTIYFVGDRVVLTGDTLFVDGVGRPDLAERAEEFAHNLYRSLHERVLTLADDALVLPGHYGDTVRVRARRAGRRDPRRRCGRRSRRSASTRTRSSRGRPRARRRDRRTTSRSSRRTWAARTCRAELQRLEVGPNRCSA